jgi:hypothetical protein
MARSRRLIRDPDDRDRVKGFLQARLDAVRRARKSAGGMVTTARLKEREDLLLEVWGVLLQGTRTATVFADGGPIGGGETANADNGDTER